MSSGPVISAPDAGAEPSVGGKKRGLGAGRCRHRSGERGKAFIHYKSPRHHGWRPSFVGALSHGSPGEVCREGHDAWPPLRVMTAFQIPYSFDETNSHLTTAPLRSGLGSWVPATTCRQIRPAVMPQPATVSRVCSVRLVWLECEGSQFVMAAGVQ